MRSSSSAPNRLIDETSPYLLQHAHNPVDWYPWGEEAFARARTEDKPVFLSVGYSACHWCHVMEHESFEDEGIAAVMNEHFVNIKVDREERPDIDQIYMSAVQLMTQRGGWPMSVFLTPEKEPFYGGTYWPPTSRMGMPGFRDILLKIHDIWTGRREEVTRSATSLVEAVDRVAAPAFGEARLDEDVLRNAMRRLLASADRTHGGFGGAPKFPHPMDVRVLLRCWRRFGDNDALHVARLTLEKMARGGIYDHLGGGFHRYSTDVRWLVPHFEKMLYDNALLVPAYLEAYQITGEPLYARVVRETLDYVLREMTAPERGAEGGGEGKGGGGFFSTQDADSEGEEGKFFVWSEEEIVDRLGAEEARLFNYAYDVTTDGNWEGHNILNRPKTDEQAAAVLGVDVEELREVLARGRRTLFEARSQRVAPGRDEKIITAWNGWMISAMAQAAAVLGEERFLNAAVRAADFVLEHVRDRQGRLLHTLKDGRAAIPAFLDDYAGFIDGLVDVYQAGFDPRYLAAARELARQMIDHFADNESGGFFYTPADHEPLITRTKDTQDGATPSGNSSAAMALLRLGHLCGDTAMLDAAHRTLHALSGLVAAHPGAAGGALLAVDFQLGPPVEIAFVEGADPRATDELIAGLHRRFLPHKVIARGPSDSSATTDVALLAGRPAQDAQASVYVCREGTCTPPITDAEALWAELEGAGSRE